MPPSSKLCVVDSKITSPRCELNIVDHCNLSCRGCSHLSPALFKAFLGIDSIVRDLSKLSPVYLPAKLRILGGEPLLHPDLMTLLREVRAVQITNCLEIVTNGTLLERMPNGFWSLPDTIWVTEYPGHEMNGDLKEKCRQKAQTAGTQLEFRRVSEFRESYSEVGTTDPDTVQRIYDHCEIAHRLQCHTVYRGYFFKCPQASLLPRLLSDVQWESQGVSLHDTPDLSDVLTQYLSSSLPLQSCRYCLGSAGRRFAHETTQRGEWRAKQRLSTENLIDPSYFLPEQIAMRSMILES